MDIVQKFVFERFDPFKNCKFVEVGAYDGITQSPTYFLEKTLNWSGLLIEPSEVLRESLIKNRPNSIIEICAITDRDGEVYGNFNGGMMSSINAERQRDLLDAAIECIKKTREDISTTRDLIKEDFDKIPEELKMIKVKSMTMKNILKKYNLKEIDLCSIDVEGHELEVLKSIDFDEVMIKNFVIEITKNEKEIIKFLEDKKYYTTCITNYSKHVNPGWDGTHQDYFFNKK